MLNFGATERYANFTAFFIQKSFLVVAATYRISENFETNETHQNLFVERGVRSPGKRNNVALIHPMNCKSQIFIDEVLQGLVDK